MKKKEYKTPRSKVILLNFRNTFLDNSVGGSEEDTNEEADAKRAFGRFASWEDDDEF